MLYGTYPVRHSPFEHDLLVTRCMILYLIRLALKASGVDLLTMLSWVYEKTQYKCLCLCACMTSIAHRPLKLLTFVGMNILRNVYLVHSLHLCCCVVVTKLLNKRT